MSKLFECEDCGWTCAPPECDNPECDNCGGELVPADEPTREQQR